MHNIEEILNKLSINEKIEFLRGINFWELKKDDRFNLKGIRMSDTTSGIRKVSLEVGLNEVAEKSVLYPTSSALACSFDRKLLENVGKNVALDAKAQGINCVLGPGINIKRSPLCGRNFEYFSEDPCLTGELALSYVKGMENEKVATCLKHFACNSTENERARINEVVDERALHEIYLEAFRKVITSTQVGSVMTSYNKVNGVYTAENKYLLKDVMRDTYHYNGLIMSDWMAVNDSIASLLNGLDLEMPNAGNINYFKLLEAYNNKKITEEDINKPLRNILNFIYKYQDIEHTDKDFDAHHEFAIKAAEESIVLAKNDDDILPISTNDTILLVGDLVKNPHIGGKGSACVNPYKVEDFFYAIKEFTTHYTYLKGYDDKDEGENSKLLKSVLENAKNKNKVIVFLGTSADDDSEGFDLENASLSKNQIKLIHELYKINKNIVVVLESGNVKELPFIDKIKGLLITYLGGEGLNKALVNTLYGKNNPSGRLSETYFKELKDHPSYHYLNNNLIDNLHKESIFVGYRYFVSYPEKVLFPFGYGLSYSKFEYKDINIDRNTLHKDESLYVYLDILNKSSRDAKEVIEIYIEKPNDKVFNAKKELKNFEKVEVKANGNYHLTLKLDYKDFSYYDIKTHSFRVEKGNYKVYVSKDSLNDLKVFDLFIEGEDIESPYLNESKKESSESNLIESKLKGARYFTKEVTELSDSEFKEIDSNIVINDPKDYKFDYSSSFNIAIKLGSKGAKKVKNLMCLYPKLKDNKETQAYVFGTPLRQFMYFVPGITESDLDLLLKVFNSENPIINATKFLNRVKKVAKAQKK